MNIFSTILGLMGADLALVGFIPLFGWLNWFAIRWRSWVVAGAAEPARPSDGTSISWCSHWRSSGWRWGWHSVGQWPAIAS